LGSTVVNVMPSPARRSHVRGRPGDENQGIRLVAVEEPGRDGGVDGISDHRADGAGELRSGADTATTGAPAAASAVAIPRPRPRDAPTTIADLADKSLMTLPYLRCRLVKKPRSAEQLAPDLALLREGHDSSCRRHIGFM
jgi:hypothetical protein